MEVITVEATYYLVYVIKNCQVPDNCIQVIMQYIWLKLSICLTLHQIYFINVKYLTITFIWNPKFQIWNLKSQTRWSGRAEEQESPPRGRDRQGPRRVSASRQRWDQRPVRQAEGEDRRDRLALRQEREARGEPEGAQRKTLGRHGEEQDGQLE